MPIQIDIAKAKARLSELDPRARGAVIVW